MTKTKKKVTTKKKSPSSSAKSIKSPFSFGKTKIRIILSGFLLLGIIAGSYFLISSRAETNCVNNDPELCSAGALDQLMPSQSQPINGYDAKVEAFYYNTLGFYDDCTEVPPSQPAIDQYMRSKFGNKNWLILGHYYYKNAHPQNTRLFGGSAYDYYSEIDCHAYNMDNTILVKVTNTGQKEWRANVGGGGDLDIKIAPNPTWAARWFGSELSGNDTIYAGVYPIGSNSSFMDPRPPYDPRVLWGISVLTIGCDEVTVLSCSGPYKPGDVRTDGHTEGVVKPGDTVYGYIDLGGNKFKRIGDYVFPIQVSIGAAGGFVGNRFDLTVTTRKNGGPTPGLEMCIDRSPGIINSITDSGTETTVQFRTEGDGITPLCPEIWYKPKITLPASVSSTTNIALLVQEQIKPYQDDYNPETGVFYPSPPSRPHNPNPLAIISSKKQSSPINITPTTDVSKMTFKPGTYTIVINGLNPEKVPQTFTIVVNNPKPQVPVRPLGN